MTVATMKDDKKYFATLQKEEEEKNKEQLSFLEG